MVNVILFMMAVIIFFVFWRVLLPVAVLIAVAFFGTIYYQEWKSERKKVASEKWDAPATSMPQPISTPTPVIAPKVMTDKYFVDGTPWSSQESAFRKYKEKKAREETQKLWEDSQKEFKEREEAEFTKIADQFFVGNSAKIYAMKDMAHKCKWSWESNYTSLSAKGSCRAASNLKTEIVNALRSPLTGSVPISIMRKYHSKEMEALDSGVEALKYATALANAKKKPEELQPAKQYNAAKLQATVQRVKSKNVVHVKRKFEPVWEH